MSTQTPAAPLPDLVNRRRRRNLFRYTLLALLSYQLPMGVCFMAKAFGIADYSYSAVATPYFAYLLCGLSALIMIRLKNQITKKFIFLILHYQVVSSMIISGFMVYAMSNQRYLVPIGCLLILMFVFMQSTLLVSFVAIFLTVATYLGAAYVGITYGGQPGNFIGEALYILVFVPVCIFIAYVAKVMQDQQRNIKKTNSKLKTTHTELEATHFELEAIHAELESHNERTMDSIRYAEMIQRSLLPGIDRIKAISPDSMFIWIPKDVVGGDIFYTYAAPDISIIAMMDCTGHGVPGAFLTLIVYAEIRKIIIDEGCRTPSEILSRLNRAVKTVLHRSNRDSKAGDGLDAAVCRLDHSRRQVCYAGAKIPLFYVTNGHIFKENGDKESIGYKDSNEDFMFTDHVIEVGETSAFYLKSDGFTDQLGGDKQLRFGTRSFKQLILDHHDQPFKDQRKIFLQALTDYQGDQEQKDDITLIGFRL